MVELIDKKRTDDVVVVGMKYKNLRISARSSKSITDVLLKTSLKTESDGYLSVVDLDLTGLWYFFISRIWARNSRKLAAVINMSV